MKDQILAHIHEPAQLEKLYRTNKAAFKREFKTLYPELGNDPLAGFWHERLNYESEDTSWGTGRDLLILLLASLLAGFIAKIPAIFSISEEFFYPRNLGFIVFPILTAYFAWKNKLPTAKIVLLAGLTLACVVFINIFPDNEKSDTLVLSAIHLALFLWSMLGFAFVGGVKDAYGKRLDFLKYNGDLVVMTTLILISGGIMTAITNGLFSLIGFDIQDFYFNYVVVMGLAAAPIVGTYLTQTNPQLVGKVSPVIAKLFSPLVLVMLIIYLIAIAYSAKDPYNDREFLLLFNALLVGVIAIIFFSVVESSSTAKNQLQNWVLFLLSVVTILVNGVALSAILFRISEWGITPNRLAVLGGNILFLVNLILVTTQLFRVISRKADISNVRKAIGSYLPVYVIWTIIVTFVFPLVFGFR